jgi:hypothetical protein
MHHNHVSISPKTPKRDNECTKIQRLISKVKGRLQVFKTQLRQKLLAFEIVLPTKVSQYTKPRNHDKRAITTICPPEKKERYALCKPEKMTIKKVCRACLYESGNEQA